MHLKMSSARSQPFCLGFSVLIVIGAINCPKNCPHMYAKYVDMIDQYQNTIKRELCA